MFPFALVDSHIHLWNPFQIRYPWLDRFPSINRPFLLEQFDLAVSTYVIDSVVFLQAGCLPEQHLDELHWVQRLAETDSRIKAIVPWAPVHDPEALALSLREMKRNTRVKGVRRIVQDEHDPEFCLRPRFLRGLMMLQDLGMHFELTIRPAQLPVVTRLVRKFPRMRFLLNHIGNPNIEKGGIEPWASDLRVLALEPNVYCKISSLPVNAGYAWTREQLLPYILVTIEAFGWQRIMFAGDWPNLLRAASYVDWLEALDWATCKATPKERLQLFRSNALKFYGLSPVAPQEASF